jgi:prepilin-type N-terminal cleavage/methylation domain-containing protein
MAVLPHSIPDIGSWRVAPRRQVGFTLIELIVVIVIVGILAGFAVMSINRTERDGVGVCQADAQIWLEQQAVLATQRGATVYIGLHAGALTSFGLTSPVPSVVTPAGVSGAAGSLPDQMTTRAPLNVDHIGVLNWAAGCQVTTQPDAGLAARLGVDDPRATALLAVTAQGAWSAPNGLPVLDLRGVHGQTRSLDLAPPSGTGSP